MVYAQDNGFCALDNFYPGHLVGALDKWLIPSTPGVSPGQLFYPQDSCFILRTAVSSSGQLVCTQFLHPLHPVLWRTPFPWLWEWGRELWAFVSCAGIQLIPVISFPRGWDAAALPDTDGMQWLYN